MTIPNWIFCYVYVQVWEHRLKVTRVDSDANFDEQPLVAIKPDGGGKPVVVAVGNSAAGKPNTTNPFSHPRTLIADFALAEKVLAHAISAVARRNLVNPMVMALVQPMERLEGGITPVEERAFHELAFVAGARRTSVYVGSRELTKREVVAKLKNESPLFEVSLSRLAPIFVGLAAVMAIFLLVTK